jgi:SAM-dependent methyltransferase
VSKSSGDNMFSLFRLRRSRGPVDLIDGMAGVRLGERLLQAGVGHPKAFAILAGKAGLTGRACAVVDEPAAARQLEAAAAAEGVFVEVAVAHGGLWPYPAGSFDVGLLDGNALLAAGSPDSSQRLRDMLQALRQGGRVLVVYAAGRGLAARFRFLSSSATSERRGQALAVALQTTGFRPVRVLAQREGMLFVEGFRPGSGTVI